MSVIEFEVFRDYLGVGATDPEVDDVSRLYDAILSGAPAHAPCFRG